MVRIPGQTGLRGLNREATSFRMSHRLTDAALLLVGHGSTVNADSSRPTREHAEALRRRGCFAEVATAYWKEHPTLAGGLRQTLSPRVFVVPLFISEG